MIAYSQGSDLERYNLFSFIQRQEVAEKRITIVLIEERYDRSTWVTAITKDSGTKKLSPTSHTPYPRGIKEA